MMPERLFHCLYKAPQGEFLRTTYDGEINGRQGRFLFAATHLSKALAFSFSYHDREVGCNGAIEGTDEEFVLVCGGQETLDKPRHIRVYEFSSESFEEIEGARQCVSETPVPFSQTQLVLETRNIDDLMRNGLQIFLMEKNAHDFFEEGVVHSYKDKSNERMLNDLLKRGIVRWINLERNIGISSALISRFTALNQQIPAQIFEYNM